MQSLLSDPSARSAALGFDREEDDIPLLSVVDAQFGHDGRTIWVLDGYPPFVRRYSIDGELQTAFLTEGRGPGEARYPRSLAISDSLVAVLHENRISIFHPSGDLYRAAVELPMIAEAIGSGCNGEWIVSGRLTSTSDRNSAGVFSVHVPPSGPPQLSTLWADTSTGPQWGKGRRIVSETDGFVVFDPRRDNGAYHRVRCGRQSEPELLAHAPPPNAHMTWETRPDGNLTSSGRIDDDTAIPRGFVPLDHGVLAFFATFGHSRPEGTRIETLSFGNAASGAHVRVDGSFAIADTRENQVLLIGRDPADGVFILPLSLLLRSLNQPDREEAFRQRHVAGGCAVPIPTVSSCARPHTRS